ncbi:MAG: hypothetical protein ACP5KG_11410 [Myxococcota bacterium]
MKLSILTFFSSLTFSIILLFLPLTATPSYESAMAINIFILIFYIYLSHKLQKIYLDEDFVETSLSITLILFFIPLILLTISGTIKGFCPGLDGYIFYFILIAPLLMLLSSISLIFRRLKLRPYIAAILIFMIILFSITFNIYELLSQPKVRFYSLFWGLFSGPIYDEDITPDRVLILYKLLSIIISTSIWLFLYKRSFIKNLIVLFLIPIALIIHNEIDNLEYNREDIKSVVGAIYKTEHFDIIYPPDQDWSREIETIANLHEYYYSQLLNRLELNTDIRITSFIFRNEDEKKELTGASRTQIAKPWLKEIYLTPISLTDSKLCHEISHILVGQLLDSPLNLYGRFKGLIPNMAVIEGISVALEPETNILTLHEKAAILLKKDKLPSFKGLFNVRIFYSLSGGISYSASGSFIKFLIERYGVDKFKRILNYVEFEEVYKKSLSEIESEYRDFLSRVEITPQKEYWASVIYSSKGIIDKQCPHEIANIKNIMLEYNRKNISTKAYKIGEEIVDYCSLNSDITLELTKALINLTKYDEAENLVRKNIHKSENAYYYTILLDTLSDILILKGDIDTGIALIENHIDRLPDSDAKRNYEIKRFLYQSKNIDLLKKFYSIEKSPNTRAGILSDVILNSNNLVARYLFGRLLYNSKDYINASKHLSFFLYESINHKEMPDSVLLESANMLLTSYIILKDYKSADKLIALIDGESNNRFTNNDFHRRKFEHIKAFYLIIKKKM